MVKNDQPRTSMEISQQFTDEGYVIIKKLFSQAEIEQIIGIVDPIYQQWLHENSSALREHQLVNMHSLEIAANNAHVGI